MKEFDIGIVKLDVTTDLASKTLEPAEGNFCLPFPLTYLLDLLNAHTKTRTRLKTKGDQAFTAAASKPYLYIRAI